MVILLQRSNMNFFGNIIERPTGSVKETEKASTKEAANQSKQPSSAEEKEAE